MAFVFLADGETEKATITNAELDRQASVWAALLQARGLAGERVLLLFPPGLDYIAAFFGCLYAGAVAVPAYPPRRGRSLDRLRAIANDARAAAVLAAPTMRALTEPQQDSWPEPLWLTSSDLDPAADWCEPALGPTNLAMLQYTSGSTSAPKGVMLTHGNLLHNCEWVRRLFGHTPESRGIIWLPPYHDMGLIGGILQPLYTGFVCHLLSPVLMFASPFAWLQAISRFGGTTSGGPNFAYDLCVRKVTPEQRATLDLSAWQVAFTGAEPVRAETLERFATTFGPCGFRREAFYPCYGLAEATLIAAGGRRNAAPRTLGVCKAMLETGQVKVAADGECPRDVLVSCGSSLDDQSLIVVDPERQSPCPPGRVGEVWLSGPSVAQAYWERPDESRQTFGATLADTGEGPFLRTGDLGFLHDGALFVTGRRKDLIILRGRNLYPHDLELSAERSHRDLQRGSCAAFAVVEEGLERLVIACEAIPRRQPQLAEVAEAVCRAISEEHEADLHAFVLLRPGGLPKTSSGKIQRGECRRLYQGAMLDALGQWHAQARSACNGLTRSTLLALPPDERAARVIGYVRGAVARMLGEDTSRVDPDRPLNTFGLSSLATLELKNAVEENLGVTLPLTHLLQGASLSQLAAEIDRELSTPEAPSERLDLTTLLGQLQRLSDDEVKTLLASDDASVRSILT